MVNLCSWENCCLISVHEDILTMLDILNNIFIMNARHFLHNIRQKQCIVKPKVAAGTSNTMQETKVAGNI